MQQRLLVTMQQSISWNYAAIKYREEFLGIALLLKNAMQQKKGNAATKYIRIAAIHNWERSNNVWEWS